MKLVSSLRFTSMDGRRSPWFNVVVVVLLHVRRQCFAAGPTTTVEVCHGRRLNASCPGGTVLMVDNAVHGRMQFGKCRVSNIELGCSADVTSYVERQCAGRRGCKMTVSDELREWAADNHGCPSDMLGYLRVTYRCIAVYEGDAECDGGTLTVTSQNTYLANVVTQESRRGSSSCPWLVRVSRGQTVNLTLFDFDVQQDKSTTSGGQFATCQIYAQMYFGAAAEPATICSRGVRQRVLHTQTGRQDIRIVIGSDRSSRQNFHFLLHVEVRQTYGCPEYKATDDQSVLSQNNETVVLRCVRGSNDARTWTVHCVDGQWTTTDDQSVDCRALADRGPSKLGSSTDLGNQTILIVLAVALTLTLIIIAVCVILYLRSKWRQRRMHSQQFDPCMYGTATTFGLHTLPPGVDYCDAASVGACSRARSQRDLLCHTPGTPQWTPRSRRACPPGTYATTLEMRRNGSVPGYAPGGDRLQHAGGSQMTLQDVWTTAATPCPVHGSTATYGRQRPIHHVYDMPLIEPEFDGGGHVMPAPADPTSPFYHELDGPTLGLAGGPTPPPPRPDDPARDGDPNSAPFARI